MSGHGDVRPLAQLGQEEVTIGDFATAQVADTFGLAYLVYNTITKLSPTRLSFDEYDVATRILYSHHYRFVGERLEIFSAPIATSGRPSST